MRILAAMLAHLAYRPAPCAVLPLDIYTYRRQSDGTYAETHRGVR